MRNFLRETVVKILTLEARFLLWRFEPKIIVVTGSVGKTSTKDAVYTAISAKFKARKSEKSYNTEIGVPLTILDLPNVWSNPFLWGVNIIVGALKCFFLLSYPKYLVLEVGADKPGDIKKTMDFVKPDVVVATRFPKIPVHVEFYKDPEELMKEEAYPAEVLSSNGILVLNDDDESVLSLKNKFRGKTVSYGLTPRADVSALGEEIIYIEKDGKEIPEGIRFPVSYKGEKIMFNIKKGLGITHIYPTLAAVAVGLSLGIEFEKLEKAFLKHKITNGRMRIIEGIKNTIIIDDTYNASPVATEVALRTLSKIKSKRTIAVLGDMKELGDFSKDEHKKVGAIASEILDILITVGIEAREIAEGALSLGMDEKNIYQFEEAKSTGKFLEGLIREGDLILIKGSQLNRMERTVQEIMLHPENRDKLLVRQDEEWLRR